MAHRLKKNKFFYNLNSLFHDTYISSNMLGSTTLITPSILQDHPYYSQFDTFVYSPSVVLPRKRNKLIDFREKFDLTRETIKNWLYAFMLIIGS